MSETPLGDREEILASLGRVAALVAGGTASAEVFAAIAREVASLLEVPLVEVSRFEPDGTATVIGAWSERAQPFEAGTRWPLDGPTISGLVKETGAPARVDDYGDLPGGIARAARAFGLRAAAGAPIVLDGQVWGSMAAATFDRSLPAGVEHHVAEVTALIAATFSSRASGDEVARLLDEQAALRRVATLVARGAPPPEVFAATARELGAILHVDATEMSRVEPDRTVTVVAAWSPDGDDVPVDTRAPIDGDSVVGTVVETGRPARKSDYRTNAVGELAELARDVGVHTVVGAPVFVDERVWGVMMAASRTGPLPPDTEERIAAFSELAGTAISNADAKTRVARLADEQAALRRVATLVARGAPPPEVFAAIARELGAILRVETTQMARLEADKTITVVAAWSTAGDHVPVDTRVRVDGDSVVRTVLRTGSPARKGDYRTNAEGDIARIGHEVGVHTVAGAPVIVDARVWGVMIAASKAGPLPPDTEARIAAFSELAGTAISNADAKTRVARLADEQAALRRVATLVAHGVVSDELFGAVAEESGRLLGADLAGMIRYLSEDSITPVATWAAVGEHPDVSGVWSLEGDRLASTIVGARRPAREDDWSRAEGSIATAIRDRLGIHSTVGCPVVVEDSVWGGLFVHFAEGRSAPADAEVRLGNFTELVATAIANASARTELRELADEQAALRRVATLVALERSPGDVFAGVAEELKALLDVHSAYLVRYRDDTAVIVGESDAGVVPMGTPVALEPESVIGQVHRTGAPARNDDYEQVRGEIAAAARSRGMMSAVGAPIVVHGRLWGAMVVSASSADALPAETEARISQFAALVATAISNVEARSEVAASRARIVEAADAERRRVVRDLHDGAQQRLVATTMTLRSVAAMLDMPDAAALVAEAIGQAEQANAELRELAHGILPAVLTAGGLDAGVRALASRMSLPIDLDVSVGRLPARIEATAYFIVAEALTNVAKHAQATRATVSVHASDGMVSIRVRDDGTGGAHPDGTGLVGLADRLAVLDGRLRIQSPAGAGTSVTAEIPIQEGRK